MRAQLRRPIAAVSTAAVVAILWSVTGTVSVVGQSPAMYEAPRTADGHPDLSGVWQALNSANWDLEDHGARATTFTDLVGTYLAQPPGLSVVEGGTIPYTPEALAQRSANFEERLDPDPYRANDDWPVADPEAKCYGAAPPRGNYLPYPFQIVQSNDAILIAYEYAGTPRVVHLGEVDESLHYGINTWAGQSRGHWEGDTLVVEVQGFSGKPWLDRAGNFMTEVATVVERYTPTSPYHLMYEATIEDATVFTRPWKLSMPLYRRIETNAEILEFQCVPLVEEYLYGKHKKPGS